jgi:hypothetical protein
MMPGIWVVLVPVTPFPAAVSPGELRTAERADLLAGLAEFYGKRIACHLRAPLSCQFGRVRGLAGLAGLAAAPAAGCSRI